MAYKREVKKLIIISFLVAAGLPCLAGPFTPEYMDITVNGEVRNFGYYVPDSYDPSTPTPLLFMFHGAGGNNSEASGGSAENGYYAWQSSADENGFIVLFPKKECCFGFNLWSLSSDSVDLDFVDAEESIFLWAKQFGYKGEKLTAPTSVDGKLETFSYLDGDVVHIKVVGGSHGSGGALSEKLLLDFLKGH